MKLFNHSPLEGKKFQVVGRVMGFSLCQAPTTVGYDCIHTILVGLVEHGSQAKPTSISVELKRLGEIHVSKDRHSGNSLFKSSKACWLPVIPPIRTSHFLIASTLNYAYNKVTFNKKIGYNEGKSLHQIFPIHL